jgi:hypothetical protein
MSPTLRAGTLASLLALAGCQGVIESPTPLAAPTATGGGTVTGVGTGGGGGSDLTGPCVTVSAERRVFMLTRQEYDATVTAALADTSAQAKHTFPAEYRANGFTANAEAMTVDSAFAQKLMAAAETIAAARAPAEVAALGCALSTAPQASPADACAVSYITRTGRQLFRAPLEADEVSALYDAYLTGFQNPTPGHDAKTSAVELVLATMLQMPQFLYRTELGDPADVSSALTSLTPYETASALAYLVTASPPDATLAALADQGPLSSAQLSAQFDRLVATPAGHARVQQFVTEWLGADTVTDLGNAGTTLTPAIAAAMLTETQRFVDYAVFQGTGTLDELLTADYTFADASLAQYYGLTPVDSSSTFNRLTNLQGQRQGLLTQGSFLTTTATVRQPILRRGATIRSKLLCQQLPSVADLGLPGFVPSPLGAPAAGTTARQALEAAVPQGTACYSCHQFFMPIGFGLEHYDANGRYRTTDNGGLVDTSGFVAWSTRVDASTGLILDPTHTTTSTFPDTAGLLQTLASDPRVGTCFSKKVWVFASGRTDVGLNECAVNELQAQFAKSGNKVLPALSAYVQSASFVQRKR